MKTTRIRGVEFFSACDGGGPCVLVGRAGSAVLIGDSKNPGREPMEYDLEEWNAFHEAVRNGEFDHIARAGRYREVLSWLLRTRRSRRLRSRSGKRALTA
jgi:hypothetical protein